MKLKKKSEPIKLFLLKLVLLADVWRKRNRSLAILRTKISYYFYTKNKYHEEDNQKKLVQFQCYAIYRNDTAKALNDPTMGIEDLKYHLLMGWELSKCF